MGHSLDVGLSWLASADLDMALIGKPSLSAAAGPVMAAGDAGGAGH